MVESVSDWMVRGSQVEFFRYKDTLKHDMQAAALVISHAGTVLRPIDLMITDRIEVDWPWGRVIAGAGSVMEALDLRKPLVVVVNAALMDDHQKELADALAEKARLPMSWWGTLHFPPPGLSVVNMKSEPSSRITVLSQQDAQVITECVMSFCCGAQGHLIATVPGSLAQVLSTADLSGLKPRERVDYTLFPRLVDEEMGFGGKRD
jgi:hypothetical protein